MLSISTIKKIAEEADVKITKDMQSLLEQIQKNAIALSIDTGELIGLIKRQDPEYAKQIEEMEK